MSWITVVWSMASAVCLTLAAIHFAIWLKRRREVAHLLFALSALGAAGSGFIQLTMLKATTVAGYVTALRLQPTSPFGNGTSYGTKSGRQTNVAEVRV